MSDPTPKTPTSTGSGPLADAMRRELADVQKQIRDLQSIQSSGRWWVAGTLVVVVGLFAVFTFYTYSRIRGNFGQQAMQRAISEHGAEVLPMAQKLLTETGQNVLPVYRDAIVTTFRTRGPQAASAAVTRMREVPEQTGKEFQAKAAAAFDAALKQVEPEFKAAFPNVTDDRRQQLMQAFVGEQIDAQNKRVASRVSQLYTNDLIHMQTVLDKFQLPDPETSAAGQAELEKRFLHTMVSLLDDQVDAAYPAAPPAEAVGRKHPATRPAAAPPAAASIAP
jgi:hypothetical protein